MPEPLAGLIAPPRTALVVVDVQVDFAAPAGLIGRSGADLSAIEPAVDRIEALIAAARAAGVTVAFLRVLTRAETDSPALVRWMDRRGTPGGEAFCRIGEHGADYHRIAPARGDIEVAKRLYSGFHATDLDAQLRARGVDTLIVTGISTDCCVDSTARDAFHRDYHVFVVADACATYDADLHANALAVLEMHCALIVSTEAVVDAWGRALASPGRDADMDDL